MLKFPDVQYVHGLTLAADYQLTQSVLRDRVNWVGIVRTCSTYGSCRSVEWLCKVGTGWAISHLVCHKGV